MPSKARRLGNTGCISANLEHCEIAVAFESPLRLWEAFYGMKMGQIDGICPRLNTIIQIIHPGSFLKTEKLLQYKAFLRARTVRSRRMVTLLKKA